MTIGERILQLRKHYRLTQREFGNRIDKSSGYLSRVETNNVSISDDALRDIAREFNSSFEWLKIGNGQMLTVDIPQADTSSVGDRIHKLRLENGLTQAEFASRIESTGGMVSKVELQKVIPANRWLQKVADEFGVSMRWLLTGVEDGQQIVERNLKRISDYLRENKTARIAVMEAINSDDDGIWIRIEQLIRERQKEG